MKWYYDDKVQMLLNTYFPKRRFFRAHYEVGKGWVDE